MEKGSEEKKKRRRRRKKKKKKEEEEEGVEEEEKKKNNNNNNDDDDDDDSINGNKRNSNKNKNNSTKTSWKRKTRSSAFIGLRPWEVERSSQTENKSHFPFSFCLVCLFLCFVFFVLFRTMQSMCGGTRDTEVDSSVFVTVAFLKHGEIYCFSRVLLRTRQDR